MYAAREEDEGGKAKRGRGCGDMRQQHGTQALQEVGGGVENNGARKKVCVSRLTDYAASATRAIQCAPDQLRPTLPPPPPRPARTAHTRPPPAPFRLKEKI